jgi:hypothetical protein
VFAVAARLSVLTARQIQSRLWQRIDLFARFR